MDAQQHEMQLHPEPWGREDTPAPKPPEVAARDASTTAGPPSAAVPTPITLPLREPMPMMLPSSPEKSNPLSPRRVPRDTLAPERDLRRGDLLGCGDASPSPRAPSSARVPSADRENTDEIRPWWNNDSSLGATTSAKEPPQRGVSTLGDLGREHGVVDQSGLDRRRSGRFSRGNSDLLDESSSSHGALSLSKIVAGRIVKNREEERRTSAKQEDRPSPPPRQQQPHAAEEASQVVEVEEASPQTKADEERAGGTDGPHGEPPLLVDATVDKPETGTSFGDFVRDRLGARQAKDSDAPSSSLNDDSIPSSLQGPGYGNEEGDTPQLDEGIQGKEVERAKGSQESAVPVTGSRLRANDAAGGLDGSLGQHRLGPAELHAQLLSELELHEELHDAALQAERLVAAVTVENARKDALRVERLLRLEKARLRKEKLGIEVENRRHVV